MKIRARAIVSGLQHLLPPTLFFLICFNVIVLTAELLAHGTGASTPSHVAATLGAIVCGRAVILADKIPFFNRYPDRPLIWNTLWKAGLYISVVLVLRLINRFVRAATHDYGFSAGIQEQAAAFDWSRFWAVQLWLVILFVGYAGFGELVRALGRENILRMFFGPATAPKPAQTAP